MAQPWTLIHQASPALGAHGPAGEGELNGLQQSRAGGASAGETWRSRGTPRRGPEPGVGGCQLLLLETVNKSMNGSSLQGLGHGSRREGGRMVERGRRAALARLSPATRPRYSSTKVALSGWNPGPRHRALKKGRRWFLELPPRSECQNQHHSTSHVLTAN